MLKLYIYYLCLYLFNHFEVEKMKTKKNESTLLYNIIFFFNI